MRIPPGGGSGSQGPARGSEEKDRTLTRRTVKGAAGGLAGVDYEEERKPDPNAKAEGKDGSKASRRSHRGEKAREAQANATVDDRAKADGADPGVAVTSQVEESVEARAARRKHHKSAGLDQVRAALADRDESEDEERRDSDDDELVETFADDGVDEDRRSGLADDRSLSEPGDLSVRDPAEIERRFKNPVVYAKHAMILAEAYRRSTGATRAEGIDYLARLMLAPHDRGLSRAALRELGPTTGILDIYPLEVVAHVLVQYPGYLPKAGFGTLVRRVDETARELVTDTLTPLLLEYSPDLKIRAFALVGGGRPGYKLEPGESAGQHFLGFDSPGRFEIMISGATRAGYTVIDRLHVRVTRAKGDDRPEPSQEEERPGAPTGVDEWPKPVIRQLSAEEALGEVDTAPAKRAILGPRDLAPLPRALQVAAGPAIQLPSAEQLPDVSDLVLSVGPLTSKVSAPIEAKPANAKSSPEQPRPQLRKSDDPATSPGARRSPRPEGTKPPHRTEREAKGESPSFAVAKPESSRPQSPKESARAESPKAEGAKLQSPRGEGSRVEGRGTSPKSEGPKSEGPKSEGPTSESPKSESPKSESQRRLEPHAIEPRRSQPPEPASRRIAPESAAESPRVPTRRARASNPESAGPTRSAELETEELAIGPGAYAAKVGAPIDDEETSAGAEPSPVVGLIDDGETEALSRSALLAVVREVRGSAAAAAIANEPPTQPVRPPAALAELDAPTEAIDRSSIEDIIRSVRPKREDR